MEYLIWYNTNKTHRAINKLQTLTYMNMALKNKKKSNMLWALTLLAIIIKIK